MGFANLGKRYVGLTDQLSARRAAHGTPEDWRYRGPFPDEQSAREWAKRLASLPGFVGSGKEERGSGWRYGYIYTITLLTREGDGLPGNPSNGPLGGGTKEEPVEVPALRVE